MHILITYLSVYWFTCFLKRRSLSHRWSLELGTANVRLSVWGEKKAWASGRLLSAEIQPASKWSLAVAGTFCAYPSKGWKVALLFSPHSTHVCCVPSAWRSSWSTRRRIHQQQSAGFGKQTGHWALFCQVKPSGVCAWAQMLMGEITSNYWCGRRIPECPRLPILKDWFSAGILSNFLIFLLLSSYPIF